MTDLDISQNLFTAEALNEIFTMLHNETIEESIPDSDETYIADKIINVSDNPGSVSCDPSIAEVKGWRVTR